MGPLFKDIDNMMEEMKPFDSAGGLRATITRDPNLLSDRMAGDPAGTASGIRNNVVTGFVNAASSFGVASNTLITYGRACRREYEPFLAGLKKGPQMVADITSELSADPARNEDCEGDGVRGCEKDSRNANEDDCSNSSALLQAL